MSFLESPTQNVKAPDARLIVAIDGRMLVVDHGTCRCPSTLDLLTISRPGHRIIGFRDVEA